MFILEGLFKSLFLVLVTFSIVVLAWSDILTPSSALQYYLLSLVERKDGNKILWRLAIGSKCLGSKVM